MNTVTLYNQIKKNMAADWMSELAEETLNVSSETIDHNLAWSKISEFQPTGGWIQTLDKIGFFHDFNSAQKDDTVLAAELLNSQGQSLHIRPGNKGTLHMVTFQPNEAGRSYYRTESSHQIKLGKQKGTAMYHLYWEKDVQATQAKFSRLIHIQIAETN